MSQAARHGFAGARVFRCDLLALRRMIAVLAAREPLGDEAWAEVPLHARLDDLVLLLQEQTGSEPIHPGGKVAPLPRGAPSLAAAPTRAPVVQSWTLRGAGP